MEAMESSDSMASGGAARNNFASIASGTTKRLVSIMYPAVIMILRSVGLLMQTMLITWVLAAI